MSGHGRAKWSLDPEKLNVNRAVKNHDYIKNGYSVLQKRGSSETRIQKRTVGTSGSLNLISPATHIICHKGG